MKLVYKFDIPFDKQLYGLCEISKNLYNQALYLVKRELKTSGEWLGYSQLDKLMPTVTTLEGEINYRLLKAQVSQQCLRVLDEYKTSKQIKSLYAKRDRQLTDIYHKLSRRIVNVLVNNKIGNIVVGYNKGWKDSINIGKRNNQTFVYISYDKLLRFISYKCEMCGIKCVINEESYTSKCDGLALEKICKHEKYAGKRVKRGLFRSSVGKVVNADVNGALNILRKVVGDSVLVRQIIDSGRLFRPKRVNIF